jgi:hypothetical protein
VKKENTDFIDLFLDVTADASEINDFSEEFQRANVSVKF